MDSIPEECQQYDINRPLFSGFVRLCKKKVKFQYRFKTENAKKVVRYSLKTIPEMYDNVNIRQEFYNFLKQKGDVRIQKQVKEYEEFLKVQDRHSRMSSFKNVCRTFMNMTEEEKDNLDQAESGKTTVYLLENAVIKITFGQEGKNRIEKNNKIRQIVEEHNLEHITVPMSRLCGNYLVEERLPIIEGQRENYTVYYNNFEKMRGPYQDMVKLVKYISFNDILYNPTGCKEKLFSVQVRFDNIPFYFDENKNIKLALIDTEHFQIPERLDQKHKERNINLLIAMFPLHIDFSDTKLKTTIDNYETVEKAFRNAVSLSQRNCEQQRKGNAYDLWTEKHALATEDDINSSLKKMEIDGEDLPMFNAIKTSMLMRYREGANRPRIWREIVLAGLALSLYRGELPRLDWNNDEELNLHKINLTNMLRQMLQQLQRDNVIFDFTARRNSELTTFNTWM